MTSETFTLPDGRRLHWHEFGDPGGSPVIYTSGTPVSGLAGKSYDQAASAAGLRWICPDKPGYGGSDYHRRRSLLSWADDLTELAGQLGLDQFALAGESGGGPFTLGAAHRLSSRVRVVALIAPAAPGKRSQAERASQQVRIRMYTWLARNTPALNAIPLMMMRRSLATPAKREQILRRELAKTPHPSQEDLVIELDAVADALRPGLRGAVQEVAMIGRPWPFSLGEITTPVHLWHGALDSNAPIGGSRLLASELPDATLHVSDSADHDIGHNLSDEIAAVIASCVK